MEQEQEKVDVMLDRRPIVLAGTTYYLRNLPIAETMEWRRAVGKMLGPIMDRLSAGGALRADGSIDQGKVMGAVLPYLLGDGLDRMVALVAVYDESLAGPMAGATDVERIEAAEALIDLTFPFLSRALEMVVKIGGVMI